MTLWGKHCYYYAFFTERCLRYKEDKNWPTSYRAVKERRLDANLASLAPELAFLPLCHSLSQTFSLRWTLPQDNKFGSRWSSILYNKKPKTQTKTNNKTDFVSLQRHYFPGSALLWMADFISVAGTGEECLDILGMLCLCAWGQSHPGLPL